MDCFLLHLVIYLLLLKQSLSSDCEHARNILNCSGLTAFPNGSYRDVQIINVHNSNLAELKAQIFDIHGFRSLKTAIIRHSNISNIQPNAFSNMGHIVELYLYGNNLTELHDRTFAGLSALNHLDVGHNQIVLIDKETLQPLENIKTVDLSFNYIKSLPPQLFEHTLISEFDISSNPIHFASDGPIFISKSLTKLSLQSLNLNALSPNAFNSLPKLEFLDLSNNKLKVLPDGLFKAQTELEIVDVSSNLIFHISIDSFSVPTKIEELICEGNPVTTLNCEEILEKIQSKNDYTEENVASSLARTEKGDGVKAGDNLTSELLVNHSTIIDTKMYEYIYATFFLSLIAVVLLCILVIHFFCVSKNNPNILTDGDVEKSCNGADGKDNGAKLLTF